MLRDLTAGILAGMIMETNVYYARKPCGTPTYISIPTPREVGEEKKKEKHRQAVGLARTQSQNTARLP
jgi:hypothetical protein